MSDKNTASCTMTLKVNKGKTLSSQESSHANSYYDRFLQCPRRENPFLSKCDSQAISVRATVRPSLHHTQTTLSSHGQQQTASSFPMMDHSAQRQLSVCSELALEGAALSLRAHHILYVFHIFVRATHTCSIYIAPPRNSTFFKRKKTNKENKKQTNKQQHIQRRRRERE